MQTLFAGADYTGERFHLFGQAHLITIGVLIAIYLAVWLARNHFSPRSRSIFRYSLAGLLLINEFAYHVWRWQTGQWTIQIMLPLHLCAVMVYGSAIMLITKNYAIYHFVYFMGLGAAMQAALTPDAGIYGFPHFRFFEIFISHGGIILAALYMTFVERYRPHWKSLLWVIVALNIYMVGVQIVNFSIGSNYLWIARTPDFPTLIDLLGPWPWYILSLEAIVIVVCLVLYLPFVIMDWRNRNITRKA